MLNIQEHNTSITNLKSYTQNAIVYNLTVANDHTYFVGLDGVLGHNMDKNCPWNPKKTSIFGKHTFTGKRSHGENASIDYLKHRAKTKGIQIGQFLDNKAASPVVFTFINKAPGEYNMILPGHIKARVFLPGGQVVDANMLRVIVGNNKTITTAFPWNINYSSGGQF